ncbi:MAG TPA: tRNA lysidine(34) synthetase TilS [Candidatus Omnitrophota bacterium]|nr:tRNA lysidine(34) synthetase TilS [Candidatus Omnitrophota bacterium]HPD85262.1 tRNA lysidine(34) synthetase TilS [Candidatus Omnitrophota bacterium]HRZ04237.1 tRNA lysidine(34) synthetase TilS [Candidatus Omnitrophota bacterium]
MNILEKTKKTIQRYQLFNQGDRVLVGVSGGPDSVALLSILNALRHTLSIHLVVAHFNHNLRKNSVTDQRFVENLARSLQLPFISAQGHLRKSRKKSSVEEIARESRFKFLLKAAKKLRANKIALGHTQDDLAETVLMRILRGTGLGGMRGILPKRTLYGIIFVRPLIETGKKDVLDFLKERTIKFRIDPTNKTTKFFRNKIRKELLPLLERKYSKNIRQILANLSTTITADYDYLEQESGRLFRTFSPKNRSLKNIRFNLRQLEKIHPSLQRSLIRLAIENLKGDTRKFGFDHMSEIEDLLTHRPTGSVVHLPCRIQALKEKTQLSLRRKTTG